VKETVDRLHRDAEWSGATEVEGHTEECLKESDKTLGIAAKRYGIIEEVWKSIRGDKTEVVASDLNRGGTDSGGRDRR
jgi:hypothetical protein